MARLHDWLRASGLAEGGLAPAYRAEPVSSKRLEESDKSNPHDALDHGDVLAKSKLGQVEIQKPMSGSGPTRYLARSSGGRARGSFGSLRDAMNEVRKPTNPENFISGYMRPEPEWKTPKATQAKLDRIESGSVKKEHDGGDFNSKHPRGNDGRFIDKQDIEDASHDRDKAAKLFDRVRPQDVGKLETDLKAAGMTQAGIDLAKKRSGSAGSADMKGLADQARKKTGYNDATLDSYCQEYAADLSKRMTAAGVQHEVLAKAAIGEPVFHTYIKAGGKFIDASGEYESEDALLANFKKENDLEVDGWKDSEEGRDLSFYGVDVAPVVQPGKPAAGGEKIPEKPASGVKAIKGATPQRDPSTLPKQTVDRLSDKGGFIDLEGDDHTHLFDGVHEGEDPYRIGTADFLGPPTNRDGSTNYRTMLVDPSAITQATQQFADGSRVKYFIDNPDTGYDDVEEIPKLVIHRGEVYVHDGHHRAVAAKLAGRPLLARVADDGNGKGFETFSSKMSEVAPAEAPKAAVEKNPNAALPLHPTSTVPTPPKVGAATYQSYQKKMDAIYAAAMSGDRAAVEAIETNATSKTHWTKKTHQYKQEVLAAMSAPRQAPTLLGSIVGTGVDAPMRPEIRADFAKATADAKAKVDAMSPEQKAAEFDRIMGRTAEPIPKQPKTNKLNHNGLTYRDGFKPSKATDALQATGHEVLGIRADEFGGEHYLVKTSTGETRSVSRHEAMTDFKQKAVLDPLPKAEMAQRASWHEAASESPIPKEKVNFNGAAKERWESIAGDTFNPATFIGASADGEVHVLPNKGKAGGVFVNFESEGMQASVHVGKSKSGEVTVHLSGIQSYKPGSGAARPVVKAIIANAKKLGAKSITLDAVGEGGDNTGPLAANGYYTWARYGFDAPISKFDHTMVSQNFPKAKKLSDVMATPEGRDWWKKNGDSWKGEFDLDPNSRSMQTFTAYLVAKGEA